MKLKYLILFFTLLLPYLSYGDGGLKAVEGLLNLLEAIPKVITYLTALSFFFLIWFLNRRNKKAKVITLLISIPLTIIASVIILSVPGPEAVKDSSFQQSVREGQPFVYLILILNLAFVLTALWCKAYPNYEVLLGKISQDNRIITWAKLRKISFGQWVELSYHRAFFKDGLMVLSSAELDEERKKFGNMKFESFDEALGFLKNTYNLDQLKFIENRNFLNDLRESTMI